MLVLLTISMIQGINLSISCNPVYCLIMISSIFPFCFPLIPNKKPKDEKYIFYLMGIFIFLGILIM
jgi:hypothetical protein